MICDYKSVSPAWRSKWALLHFNSHTERGLRWQFVNVLVVIRALTMTVANHSCSARANGVSEKTIPRLFASKRWSSDVGTSLDRFRTVSDGFGPFLARFGSVLGVLRPFRTILLLILKISNFNWPRLPFRPPSAPSAEPWPIEIWNLRKNRKKRNENEYLEIYGLIYWKMPLGWS